MPDKDENPDRLAECKFCRWAYKLCDPGVITLFVCMNETCDHLGHVIVGDHGCYGWDNKDA